MKTVEPQAVQYFIGALFSDRNLLEKAHTLIHNQIGGTEFIGEAFPFDVTDYYNNEMGSPIFRIFMGFEMLRSPGDLAHLKQLCNAIEDELQVNGKRKVNLDVGYLDLHKVVLASAKYNGQKIYLSQGIYADTTLVFEHGAFQPLKNTFPDFKSGHYDDVFTALRNIYKLQLKSAQ